MQISERELRQRKELLQFTIEDVALLSSYKSFIAEHVDLIVNRFYDKQIKTPEISLLIGDSETLRLLRNAMRRYILELFEGIYDADYVNRRLRIGKVHKRIGVSPKLYLSAVWLLQTVLDDQIDQHFTKANDEAGGTALKASLNKLITLDTQLIFDTYISSLVSEVAAAKEEMTHYAASLEEIVAQRTHELEELSRKDSLTGLFNQRAFHEFLRRDLASSTRYNETLCLAYFDLNEFKQLNDKKGHIAGDELLALVGRSLLNAIRETDIACRYGGDEFAIIMPRTELKDAHNVCKRIIEDFEKSPNQGVSLSIGVACTSPDEPVEADTLIRNADNLMYESKKEAHEHGGSYISLFNQKK